MVPETLKTQQEKKVNQKQNNLLLLFILNNNYSLVNRPFFVEVYLIFGIVLVSFRALGSQSMKYYGGIFTCSMIICEQPFFSFLKVASIPFASVFPYNIFGQSSPEFFALKVSSEFLCLHCCFTLRYRIY